ncbi:MAG TPA: TetR/AcrR family transcriptional regulator [Alloacidobacterium sp.]|jgi:AcrR family transcriptional regulator|nr:TetR/AcrR family transcriptional regulator [Alloacidobacterium sp.]
MPAGKRTDRRVARTRKALLDALHSLICEKDYDSIVVKEILDRADVGRSAFYTHFVDKDDLLAHGIHDIVGGLPARHSQSDESRNDGPLWFSQTIFEHVDRQRRTTIHRLGRRGAAILHQRLNQVLVKMIAEQLDTEARKQHKRDGGIPSDLLAQYLAGTFVLVLNWWIESKSQISPSAVNDLFSSLVMPVLASN